MNTSLTAWNRCVMFMFCVGVTKGKQTKSSQLMPSLKILHFITADKANVPVSKIPPKRQHNREISSKMQPLVKPLFQMKHPHQILIKQPNAHKEQKAGRLKATPQKSL